MVAKYLITGVVSALLAGGAVYMVADAADLHPHETVKKRADQTVKTDAANKAKPKSGHYSSATKDASDTAGAASTIDAMTHKSDTAKKAVTAAKADVESAKRDMRKTENAVVKAEKPAPKKAWLDDYLDARQDNKSSSKMMAEQAREDEASETETKGSKSWKSLDPDAMTPKSGRKGVKDEATGTYVVKTREVEAPGVTESPEPGLRFDDGAGGSIVMRKRMDNSGQYELLIREAKKVDIPDQRDDAYFNILDLALKRDDIAMAEDVIGRISTDELRDSARTRLAVAHAKAGRIEEAFDVVDDVEIEELADLVRLEIIRTATGTER